MSTTLPLPEMTRAEKLRAMEELWDDLCHSPGEIPSPAWHGEALAERAARVDAGAAEFRPWDEVKAKLIGRKE